MPTVIIARKTSTAITTRLISQAVNVESWPTGVGVEEGMVELPMVEIVVKGSGVVELPVAWGIGVDSRPPALRAAATLKVLPATTSR